MAAVQIQPSVSPLAHALDTVSRLSEEHGTTRAAIEANHALAGVKRILANAVEEERQRLSP